MFFWRRRRHPIGDEELSAYVDGRLESAARARLEAHIEACAGCREALIELRAVQRALRELPRAAAPRSFALREADVRPAAAPQPVGALGRAPALLGGLATAAIVVFGALVGVDVLTQPSEEGAAEVTGLAASVREMDQEEAAQEAAEAAPVTTGEEIAALYGNDEKATESEPGVREEPVADQGAPTPECPPDAACAPVGNDSSRALPSPVPTPSASPSATPVLRAGMEAEDDGRTPLRAAEAATAAVALVAGVSLALVWWRRRA